MKSKIILKIFVAVIVVVLVLITASWAWLSFGSLTPVKEKIFTRVPFPAAFVGGQPVSVKTLAERLEIARSFSAQNSGTSNTVLNEQIFNNLIEQTKVQILGAQKGIKISSAQLDSEFTLREKQFVQEGQGSLDNALLKIGLSKQAYKNGVLKSEMQAAYLASWFYGQENLNSESYTKANDILNKAQAGDKFDDLVQLYSEDEQSKKLGGDTGLLDLKDLLPEIQSPLQQTNVGDIKIVSTRYGLEVVKIESKDNGKLQIRQIFLNGSDFNAWYKNETKNITVIKIISL